MSKLSYLISLKKVLCLISGFSLLFAYPSAAVDEAGTLVASTTSIRLTNLELVTFTVKASDGTNDYLYFSSGNRDTYERQKLFSGAFEIDVVSKDSNSYTVGIRASTPIRNGTYNLVIEKFFLKTKINITVEVNVPKVELTSKVSRVNITSLDESTFEVYVSDPKSIARSFLVINGKQTDEVIEPAYEARVVSEGSGSYIIGVKAYTPQSEGGNNKITNGSFKLTLLQRDSQLTREDPSDSNLLEIVIVISIDPKKLGLYTVEFSLTCSDKYYGENLTCIVVPRVDGIGEDLAAGIYEVSPSYRYIGDKSWKKLKTEESDISKFITYNNQQLRDGISFRIAPLIKPIELKAIVTFESKVEELTSIIKPYVKLNLSHVASAFVGKNFNFQIQTVKQFSGNCTVFPPRTKGFKVQVKNGFGKGRIYSLYVGLNNILVSCNSQGWKETSARSVIYIRE